MTSMELASENCGSCLILSFWLLNFLLPDLLLLLLCTKSDISPNGSVLSTTDWKQLSRFLDWDIPSPTWRYHELHLGPSTIVEGSTIVVVQVYYRDTHKTFDIMISHNGSAICGSLGTITLNSASSIPLHKLKINFLKWAAPCTPGNSSTDSESIMQGACTSTGNVQLVEGDRDGDQEDRFLARPPPLSPITFEEACCIWMHACVHPNAFFSAVWLILASSP